MKVPYLSVHRYLRMVCMIGTLSYCTLYVLKQDKTYQRWVMNHHKEKEAVFSQKREIFPKKVRGEAEVVSRFEP